MTREETPAPQRITDDGEHHGWAGWPLVAVSTAAPALAWGAWEMSGGNLWAAVSGAQLALVIVVALFAVGRWQRQWSIPVRKLQNLVPEIRAGKAPIEDLSAINGPLGPIAGLFKELLRDSRRQRAEVTALEHETRQRIANRTDALERTIGSLRHQASRDVLTGLYNRRMLEEYLPQTIKRCKEAKISLCLLMIDVDHFKLLNDTLGHAAGDELLKTIGQLIRSTIREKDLAFRCGGDEFIVQLEGCDASSGRALADRLRTLVDALAETLRVNPPPRLSIGVATLDDCRSATPEALLEMADKLLYEVKGSRRRAASARLQLQ